MKLRNWLLFILVVSLWGSSWPIMKMGLRFVPPTTFVMQRLAFSSIALFPVLLLLRRRVPRDVNTLSKLIFLGLIYTLCNVATNIGLVKESSGLGAVLTYTQPLFVFCLAISFLKEEITAIKILGAITGFMGVVILFLGRVSLFTLKSALTITLGAFLWAISIVYYKKYLSHVDPFVTSFFQLSVGVLPLAVLSLTANSFILPVDTAYLWIILYVSVGPSAVGSTLWLFLLQEEDVTVISGSSFITPVVALFLGWYLLGESLYVEALIGSALILRGVYLVNLRS